MVGHNCSGYMRMPQNVKQPSSRRTCWVARPFSIWRTSSRDGPGNALRSRDSTNRSLPAPTFTRGPETGFNISRGMVERAARATMSTRKMSGVMCQARGRRGELVCPRTLDMVREDKNFQTRLSMNSRLEMTTTLTMTAPGHRDPVTQTPSESRMTEINTCIIVHDALQSEYNFRA
jgi:hypothetical protein